MKCLGSPGAITLPLCIPRWANRIHAVPFVSLRAPSLRKGNNRVACTKTHPDAPVDDDFPVVRKRKPLPPFKMTTCPERNADIMEEIRKFRLEMNTRTAALEEDLDRINRRIASLEADRDHKTALRRLRRFFQDNSAARRTLPHGALQRFYDRVNRMSEGYIHAAHGLSREEFATTVEACRAAFPELIRLTEEEIEEMWHEFNGAGSQ